MVANATDRKTAAGGKVVSEQGQGLPTIIVPVAHIRADPKQPRSYFDPEDLQTKAESMKEDGQDKPIDVIKVNDSDEHAYQIVDGEQRWRALKLAEIGVAEVRVLP